MEYASRSDNYIVGSDNLYYKLDDRFIVPLDIVDVDTYYPLLHQEHTQQLIPVPGAPSLQMFNAPTMLAEKIVACQERNLPDPMDVLMKQLCDCEDIRFLLSMCIAEQQHLLPVHVQRFGDDPQEVLAAFAAIGRSTGALKERHFAAWNSLVAVSDLGPVFEVT